MVDVFSGVLVPLLTPFNKQYDIDEHMFVVLAEALMAQGVDGLAPFGTTSEGTSLTIDEKRALLGALTRNGVKGEKLMPGIGTPSLHETAEMLMECDRFECRGALLLPPFYYKEPLVDDQGLFDFVKEVMRRTEGVETKIYLYHIPQMASIGWSEALIARLLDHFHHRIAGLKDSTGDWAHTESLIIRFPELKIFAGTETLLSKTLAMGGAGSITATGNLNPSAVVALKDKCLALEPGEGLDPAVQASVTKVRESLGPIAPTIPLMKAYFALKTGNPNWANLRPPLQSATQQQANQLDQVLADMGFQFDLFG